MMKSAEEIYEFFKRKYPDVAERRDRICDWSVMCQEYERISTQVWKLIDMAEECNENNS